MPDNLHEHDILIEGVWIIVMIIEITFGLSVGDIDFGFGHIGIQLILFHEFGLLVARGSINLSKVHMILYMTYVSSRLI